MFWIRFRHVKKISKGVDGEMIPATNKKFGDFLDVKISRRKNKRLVSYVKTVVHEFLHVVFVILDRYFDYVVTAQSEHEYIEAMEDSTVACWYLLKEKKK